jgi:hypothetical protein
MRRDHRVFKSTRYHRLLVISSLYRGALNFFVSSSVVHHFHLLGVFTESPRKRHVYIFDVERHLSFDGSSTITFLSNEGTIAAKIHDRL